MTRRLARRGGAAAALLLAFLVATPAPPAGAAPTLTIVDPKDKQVLDKSSVTVRVSAPADLVYRAREITWSVGGKTGKVACPDVDCSASWTVDLPTNGPKVLTVSATTEGLVGLLPGPKVEASPRNFALAAPAAKPVLDPPKVNEARNTELSWSRNAEADMLYYAVFRKDPGGTRFLQVGGKVPHPKTGTKVSYTDTTTSAFIGGEYSYQVVALRRGATDSAEVSSEPSTSRAVTVPAPPTTTVPATSVVPGAPQPGAPIAGPTTTVKPGTTAGVDLSGFLSARSQPATLPTITVPEPPDTGFEGTLPFGARPDDMEEGEAEAVLPDDARSFTSIISRFSPGRPLVPVAGGLVLLLLAMHMRLLNHRIKAEPAGDLPIDDRPTPARVAAPAPGAKPAKPAPAPRPAPVMAPPPPPPQPALYDVVAEWDAADPDDLPDWSDADEDWAPAVLLEPDPEPEPEAAPEPTGDPDEIEVFEVVSSNRRHLARAGAS